MKKIEFTDNYGKRCSLQESCVYKQRKSICFGVDKPTIMEIGWHPEFANAIRVLPEQTNFVVSGHMHLTRKQIIKLLPHLKRFAKTGKL